MATQVQLRLFRPLLVQVLVLSFAINVIALVVPIFVLQVYDRVVAHAGLTTLQALLIGVAAALGLDFALRQLRSRILQRISLHIDADLAEIVMRKLVALPLRILEARPVAFWQALFRDVETVRNTVGGTAAILVCDLPFALLFLAIVFVIAPAAAWVLVLAMPLFVGIAWWSGLSGRRAGATELRAATMRDTMLGEMLAGRTTVKALNMAGALLPIWGERQAATMRAAIERGRRADRFGNLTVFLAAATTVALTAVGALAILEQNLTIGALVAANLLAARVIGPFNQLVASWRGLVAYRQSKVRLDEVLQLPEDRGSTALDFPRPRGALSAEDVSFSYGARDKPLFAHLTITFSGPGLHAIVGRNGCGKSTLLKMLMGLYHPNSGRITIDQADITQFSRDDLANWIGYLPQECVLLQGSVRQNLLGRLTGASSEAVLRAAMMAGIHTTIAALPDGYDTDVGEGGARLSGGQRQRLALARALVDDPPILMLDEPTASLDRNAEEELRDVLVQLAVDHTVLMVTHSPTLLRVCKTISILDHGGQVTSGPAGEILPHLLAGPKSVARTA